MTHNYNQNTTPPYPTMDSNGYGHDELPMQRPQRHNIPLEPENSFTNITNPQQIKLLDTLTRLQKLQIDKLEGFDLPQIIVCGVQSSGKSSVLEAITGIPFPRKGNTCTRFITKVTLKPSEEASVRVTIEPGIGSKTRSYENDFPPITNLHNLPRDLQNHFTTAEKLILGGRKTNEFSKDVLCITITGKGRPILQILDLPGLIEVELDDDIRNKDLVREMVAREMRKPNSTILAVVAANVDVQTQTIFGLCAETDRSGDRTIGIVTQPDVSPERAPMYVDLAIGKTSIGKYKYPWHVLKNRSAKELEARTDMRSRNDEEKRYLDEHPWNQIPQENRGIEALRKRLSERLFGEAIKVFPELATQATTKLSGFQRDLKALGGENRTTAEMESIFRTATKSLSKLTEAYSKGRYEYKTIDFESSHAIYLRARIVDQSELFYHRIMTEGHTWSSHIDISAIDPDSDFELSQSNSLKATMNKRKPEVMTREAEIELAKKHLREKRGNEFPLTWDPHHINEFFWKLSREWDGIASEHIAKVHTHCESYFHHATHLSFRPSASKDPKPTFTNHADVATRYFTLSKTHLKHRQDDAERELEKIESDRQGLQTNFNRAYKVQYRQQKNERNMQKAVGAFVRNMDPAETNPNTFAEHQGRQTLEDQVTEVAEDFLRAAWIHYKIMRDGYIANVITQVIERHFLQDISDVPPEREAMDERAFKALVEEDRGLEMQKAELKDKIDTLEECLEILEPYR